MSKASDKIRAQAKMVAEIEAIPTSIYEGITAEEVNAHFDPEAAGIRTEEEKVLDAQALEIQMYLTRYGI